MGPVVGPISGRMRSVLSLALAARVSMAKRMRISVHDLQVMEYVMTSQRDNPDVHRRWDRPSSLAGRVWTADDAGES